MMPPPSSPQIQLRICQQSNQNSKNSQTPESSLYPQELPTIVNTPTSPEGFSGVASSSSFSLHVTPSPQFRKQKTNDEHSGEPGFVTRSSQKLDEAIRRVDNISNITTSDLLNQLQILKANLINDNLGELLSSPCFCFGFWAVFSLLICQTTKGVESEVVVIESNIENISNELKRLRLLLTDVRYE